METNRINYITIQQYLEGKLDKEAMHELERQSLEDPFLADALDGYAQINKPATKHLSLLQTQLEERIAQQQENKNVFNFSWQRLSIAATAGLLFIAASILFWIKGQKAEHQFTKQIKQVEVSLTPADSIGSAGPNNNNIQGPMGGSTERLQEGPEPLIGWRKYKDYLEKSDLSAKVASGQVIVSFTVGDNNSLSNFKIEKGLDNISNSEAIRLIKDGPAWVKGKQSDARLTISFK